MSSANLESYANNVTSNGYRTRARNRSNVQPRQQINQQQQQISISAENNPISKRQHQPTLLKDQNVPNPSTQPHGSNKNDANASVHSYNLRNRVRSSGLTLSRGPNSSSNNPSTHNHHSTGVVHHNNNAPLRMYAPPSMTNSGLASATITSDAYHHVVQRHNLHPPHHHHTAIALHQQQQHQQHHAHRVTLDVNNNNEIIDKRFNATLKATGEPAKNLIVLPRADLIKVLNVTTNQSSVVCPVSVSNIGLIDTNKCSMVNPSAPTPSLLSNVVNPPINSSGVASNATAPIPTPVLTGITNPYAAVDSTVVSYF